MHMMNFTTMQPNKAGTSADGTETLSNADEPSTAAKKQKYAPKQPRNCDCSLSNPSQD